MAQKSKYYLSNRLGRSTGRSSLRWVSLRCRPTTSWRAASGTSTLSSSRSSTQPGTIFSITRIRFLSFKLNGSLYICPWSTHSLTHRSTKCSYIPFEACPRFLFFLQPDQGSVSGFLFLSATGRVASDQFSFSRHLFETFQTFLLLAFMFDLLLRLWSQGRSRHLLHFRPRNFRQVRSGHKKCSYAHSCSLSTLAHLQSSHTETHSHAHSNETRKHIHNKRHFICRAWLYFHNLKDLEKSLISKCSTRTQKKTSHTT